jgi:hypothetical protein
MQRTTKTNSTRLIPSKTTCNKACRIALKRTVRVSLNLINSLTSDRMDMWGTGYKISHVDPLKSSNLLGHCVLPFRMKNKRRAQKEQWL